MLTTAQVALAVGVHEETVRRWIIGGAIPATYNLIKPGGVRRVYRIDKKYVDIILAGQWPPRETAS